MICWRVSNCLKKFTFVSALLWSALASSSQTNPVQVAVILYFSFRVTSSLVLVQLAAEPVKIVEEALSRMPLWYITEHISYAMPVHC